MILIKLQVDKNANKKFGPDDDEVYFRIDLEDDISKLNATRLLCKKYSTFIHSDC